MIEGAFMGAAFGFLAGVAFGGFLAATTRDGIWPDIYAAICLAGLVSGAVVGAIL